MRFNVCFHILLKDYWRVGTTYGPAAWWAGLAGLSHHWRWGYITLQGEGRFSNPSNIPISWRQHIDPRQICCNIHFESRFLYWYHSLWLCHYILSTNFNYWVTPLLLCILFVQRLFLISLHWSWCIFCCLFEHPQIFVFLLCYRRQYIFCCPLVDRIIFVFLLCYWYRCWYIFCRSIVCCMLLLSTYVCLLLILSSLPFPFFCYKCDRLSLILVFPNDITLGHIVKISSQPQGVENTHRNQYRYSDRKCACAWR